MFRPDLDYYLVWVIDPLFSPGTGHPWVIMGFNRNRGTFSLNIILVPVPSKEAGEDSLNYSSFYPLALEETIAGLGEIGMHDRRTGWLVPSFCRVGHGIPACGPMTITKLHDLEELHVVHWEVTNKIKDMLSLLAEL